MESAGPSRHDKRRRRQLPGSLLDAHPRAILHALSRVGDDDIAHLEAVQKLGYQAAAPPRGDRDAQRAPLLDPEDRPLPVGAKEGAGGQLQYLVGLLD